MILTLMLSRYMFFEYSHNILYTQKPFSIRRSKQPNNHALWPYLGEPGVTLYCPTHSFITYYVRTWYLLTHLSWEKLFAFYDHRIFFTWGILPLLQVACGFVAARVVVILPQTYLPLYLLDTLNMDRVRISMYIIWWYIKLHTCLKFHS